MNLHRFYCEQITEPETEVAGDEANHIVSVIRAKKGDAIELFDGNGILAFACIEQIGDKKVLCRIERLKKFEKPHSQQIIIATSIPKGERFDWLITECTQLSADRIVPVIFERTVKLTKNPKAGERWKNQIIAAAKQCKRLFLPTIDLPLSLKDSINLLKTDYPNGLFLIGSCEDKSESIADLDPVKKNIIVFIGPEGGISREEEELLKQSGAIPVRINENILRVETAAIAFASILAARRQVKSNI